MKLQERYIPLHLYPEDVCGDCGHPILDDDTETTGHFADDGDSSVGQPPAYGCYAKDCSCRGPVLRLSERDLTALWNLAHVRRSSETVPPPPSHP